MTFLELLGLVNEADEKEGTLTPDEHAALLKFQTEEDESVVADREQLNAYNAELTKLTTKTNKLRKDLYDMILRRKGTTSLKFKEIKQHGETIPVVSSKNIADLHLPTTQEARFLGILNVIHSNEKDIERIKAEIQIITQRTPEESRREELEYNKEVYADRLQNLGRVQDKIQLPGSLTSIKDLPDKSTLAGDILAQAKFKAAETIRLQHELETGTGKKPFAPDPTGFKKQSSGFDTGVSYKSEALDHWGFNTQNPLHKKSLLRIIPQVPTSKDKDSQEWKMVTKKAALNIPREVSKVFNAVTESKNTEEYKKQLDDIFGEYMPIYNRISSYVHTFKVSKPMVVYLEEQLDIKYTIRKNTEERIFELDNRIKKLPDLVRQKQEQINTIERLGGDASELLIELKYLQKDLEDVQEKMPKYKGLPRDLKSHGQILHKNFKNVSLERQGFIKEEQQERLTLDNLVAKIEEENLQGVPEVTAALKEQERVYRKAFFKLKDATTKMEEAEEASKAVTKQIEKLARQERDLPALPNSRTFSSLAFELSRQFKNLRSINGQINAIKYGKALLKEVDESSVESVEGKLRMPYTTPRGNTAYYKVIRKPGRKQGEENSYAVTGFRRGLNGYGGRPGVDEEGYEGVPIEGAIVGTSVNEGYYQALENSVQSLEDTTSQLDKIREGVLAKLLLFIENTVAARFYDEDGSLKSFKGIDAVRAWIGLKKRQKHAHKTESDYFSLGQFTADPVASLHNFFINAQQRQMTRTDRRINSLSDITKKIVGFTSSMPGGTIPDDFVSKEKGERFNAAYNLAKNNAINAVKTAGDDPRLQDLTTKYFVDRSITKEEYLKQIKEVSSTPQPLPSNVVSINKYQAGAEDDDEVIAIKSKNKSVDDAIDDLVASIMDADNEAAFTHEEPTPEEKKLIDRDKKYFSTLQQKAMDMQQSDLDNLEDEFSS